MEVKCDAQKKQLNGWVKNGVHRKDPKLKPENNNWTKIYLVLLCVLLGFILMFLLDQCDPSEGSERWAGLFKAPVWDWTAVVIVLLFTVLQGALYYLPAGRVAEGKMGCNEKRMKYSLNGLHACGVCVCVLVCVWLCGYISAVSVFSRVLALISSGCFISTLISVCVYLCSVSAHSQHNTGGLLLDFVLGRELDPRLGKIDLKQFVMVRIGFIGWVLIDVCYVLTAVEMEIVSVSLILTVSFQIIYITDFLIDEESVLDTKEFTTESIGYLMILGEYIWIPFFSSLPVYFLLHRPNHIHFLSAILIILLFSVGFLIYYLSNEQKSGFRKNPNDPAYAGLQTIKSPSGQDLLVSGWFGWVRHPNYLGDVMMMLAWCLPCGFCSVLPYLPVLQCFNLLRQRSCEIETSCLQKHGDAWREYCLRVPYKLIPYIY